MVVGGCVGVVDVVVVVVRMLVNGGGWLVGIVIVASSEVAGFGSCADSG